MHGYVLLHVTDRPDVQAPKKGNFKLVGWAVKVIDVKGSGVSSEYKLKEADGKTEMVPFEKVNQMKILSD